MNTQVLSDPPPVNLVKERNDPFYVVSIRKFIVLFMATAGMYSVYWFYRNWSRFKITSTNREGGQEDLWPIARAIFSVFFVHALFREIKIYGRDKPGIAAWEDGNKATQLVIWLIAGRVVERLANRGIGSPYTDLLSLFILAPLLSQFLLAQDMINVSCDDARGDSNSNFTSANYAWIAVGALAWILILIGIVLPA